MIRSIFNQRPETDKSGFFSQGESLNIFQQKVKTFPFPIFQHGTVTQMQVNTAPGNNFDNLGKTGNFPITGYQGYAPDLSIWTSQPDRFTPCPGLKEALGRVPGN